MEDQLGKTIRLSLIVMLGERGFLADRRRSYEYQLLPSSRQRITLFG